MPTLQSLVALKVLGATSDDKVGILTTRGFQWYFMHIILLPTANHMLKGKFQLIVA